MNHLLIDVTFLINELKRNRPPHGIPRVILAYLHHYQHTIQLVYRIQRKIFIIPGSYSKQIIQLVLLWERTRYKNIVLLLIKGAIAAKQTNAKNSYFLLKIEQNGLKYPYYFRQLNRMGIKSIIMLHDLFPIIHPEYSDPHYAAQFACNIKSSLKNATAIICVSQSTQNTVTHYVQANDLICPPIIAAPLASGFVAVKNRKSPLIPGPYFVIISTIVARKNHLLLLHIWRTLVDELGHSAPKLVIIGKRSAECSTTLAMLDRCQQMKQHVIETVASDDELQNYLAYARALLFPTFAEGYGLPLIEALASNIPVLCSELPIFREIAQNVPEYLDPIDGTGWRRMIIDYAQENSASRNAQLQRLAQFKTPTWEEHFNKINVLLEQLSVGNESVH